MINLTNRGWCKAEKENTEEKYLENRFAGMENWR